MSHAQHQPPSAAWDTLPMEGAPARWKWLLVPFGHAVLTFFVLIFWWRPLPPPSGAGLIMWAATEALLQGGIGLLLTALLLWAVPRILIRQSIYIAVASAVCRALVDVVAEYVSGPVTNNGDRLDRTVATYCVVVLVSALIVRGRNHGQSHS